MSLEEIKAVTEEVRSQFGEMNTVQLNWKPDDKSWSIAQILDHIIITNNKYDEIFRNALSDKYRPRFWERINPVTKYTGSNLVKNMSVNSTKKYVSPMLFRPAKGMIGQEVIENFIKMQDEMYQLFLKLDKEVVRDRVITSPVANLITLSVGDAMQMLIVHEQRHINQANTLKNHETFPGK